MEGGSMGDMHPNAQIVMRGFQAFAEGDMATMKEVLADDVRWHTGGRNKWSGTKNGRDAAVLFMSEIAGEADFVNEPHAILADDEHVVVLNKSTATRGDDVLHDDITFIFHVSNGQVTECWGVSRDPYAGDEFWGN